jgi:DNA-binding response OmpR family regulator
MDLTMTRASVMIVGLSADHLPVSDLLEAGMEMDVSAVGDFEDAKRRLAVQVPDLLITALRLGPYNGLHLVVRGRTDNPGMAAIVVANVDDPVLRRDAEELGATFVGGPLTVEHVQSALRITAAGSA